MERKLDVKMLEKIASTIRGLSMDAVQKANSGHPGLPMGCAEIGAYLYGHALRHYPQNPRWLNRDRLVLSAGHGSMWLYSCLHLAGFNLSLEEIKRFRQLHSKTPGHPEFGETDGVEATTGPLGQGTGNAVGMALGLKAVASRFNTKEDVLFDAKVFCLCSDGDLMEGGSHEVASLAGHLKLDNLIFIYDANHICLDGPLSECSSEDTIGRFRSYGWDTYEVDPYDFQSLDKVISKARENQNRPVFILAHTIIGKGSPHKSNSHHAHGSPLGLEEVKLSKENLGLPAEEFYVPKVVESYFQQKLEEEKKIEAHWEEKLRLWAKAHPKLAAELDQMRHHALSDNLEQALWALQMKPSLAGREASHAVINFLATQLPGLYGGSADLSSSDKTRMEQLPTLSSKDFTGRNIKFGVREFGMGTIANGLALTDLIIPFVGTFLTFSDYMRNAMRLAALSKLKVIYQFTHDSIFLGEDGPTHQPVEHYAALRAMPHLHVFRPADANEVKMSWLAALRYQGPSALLLSRQSITTLPATERPFAEGVGRGGYILKKEKTQKPDYCLFATGSEVSLAWNVAAELEKRGKSVRLVSMTCFGLFEEQDAQYRHSVIGGDLGQRVSIEAGVDLGWHKYIGLEGIAICLESFGLSAPASVLSQEFGFHVEAILERILI
ncbi:MAG: transketolase [Verrucomicrobia bacterium]|nr:transketolase [Verrucomicrobiota bacterium]MBS0645115.1 transketolase [Verrucomicrobiota bacterium]